MADQLPIPNREPAKLHESQHIWQILVPVLLTVLVMVGIGVLMIILSAQPTGFDEKWAQISLVFLILPSLLIGLVLLAVLILTTRLINKSHKILPAQFQKMDQWMNIVHGITFYSAHKITTPLISIKSFTAGAVRLFELVFHCDQSQRRKNDQ